MREKVENEWRNKGGVTRKIEKRNKDGEDKKQCENLRNENCGLG